MTERSQMTGPHRLEIVRDLPAAPERVWTYLTDPTLRKKWFCGGETSDRPGGKIDLVFDHTHLSDRPAPGKSECSDPVTMTGEVKVFDPPKELAFTWPEPGNPNSVVTIKLSPSGAGTRLHLIHEGLEDPKSRPSIGAGWHAHLDLLVDLTHDRPTRDFWDHWEALNETYEAEPAFAD